jgi:hypothetical protein
MWKKSLIGSNVNVRFFIIMYVLINYCMYKMHLMNNGFNILKVNGWTMNHVDSGKDIKKPLTHYNAVCK